MVKKEMIEVIELSPSPPKNDIPRPPNRGTPLRSIFVLKEKQDVNILREIEEREDCFILDFDPCDSLDFSKLSVKEEVLDDDPELSILAEKGQVACRDYPHSRHLCSKNPFKTTPHETFCEMCYCFVCDKPAPCGTWSGVDAAHCNAIDNDVWKFKRELAKAQREGA